MIAVKTRALGIGTAVILFGGIAVGAALGSWQTTSSKEPARIKSGEFAGMPSPSDIRGSYTWADVASAFAVPEASLVAAFGGTGPDERVNSLEGRFAGKTPEGTELGTDSVRLFVSLYTGLPHETEADTVLPRPAIAILRAEGRSEPSAIDEAAKRAIAIGMDEAAAPPSGSAAGPVTQPQPSSAAAPAESADHASAAVSVTGKTTFNDLKSWGFDMDAVSEILGGLGPSGQSVRDFCSSKEMSFSEVKGKLEAIAPK